MGLQGKTWGADLPTSPFPRVNFNKVLHRPSEPAALIRSLAVRLDSILLSRFVSEPRGPKRFAR